ncbi:MAG: hypothetical protein LBV26_06705, partial [Bacteroidales bacterium]|nr:hypothetical protein [Bacteroidales bacterium]
MLRKSAFLIYLFIQLIVTQANAQIFAPVIWEFSYEKAGDSRFDIVMTATIDTGSHIYGMEVPEDGPIPTTFSFDTPESYSLEGAVRDSPPAVEKMDEAFGFRIKTYSNKVEFRQRITASVPTFIVNGSVNFMACSNSMCTPPKDVEFSIEITGNTQPAKESLLAFFFVSLIAGLAGAITPCVYPMIPLTVAFFSRGADNRRRAVSRAIVFGLSIIMIYTLPGIIVSLTGAGAGFTNSISTHWVPNAIFFMLFITFAASFFGAFEITLPGRWVSAVDSKANRGGISGAFFMALTTVTVSFSCTGPIVAPLLMEAAAGHVLRPVIGMAGFGTAFAAPFIVFAIIPSIMSRLPKSGGWLNTVKVFIGFVMLAFSMKFLMTIDSVYNLRLISRDIYLAVWIVLFTLLGFNLLGKIRFAHDGSLPYIGFFRLIVATAVFSFV